MNLKTPLQGNYSRKRLTPTQEVVDQKLERPVGWLALRDSGDIALNQAILKDLPRTSKSNDHKSYIVV